MDSADAFDSRVDAYEAMIDWPRRLANELALYRWVVERFAAHRVLDAACGTGHHAAMLAGWGLEVEAADISPAMLERAAARVRTSAGVRFVRRGFHEPVPAPASFDLAICVGNSLSLAKDAAGVQTAMTNLLCAVHPGGAVLVHVLNLWRLPQGLTQWGKCKLADLTSGRHLIIKGVHRAGDDGFVDLLVTKLEADQATLHSDCVSFLGLRAEQLERYARSAGAAKVEFFGDYVRSPYEPAASVDLIMVAQRG